MPKEIQIASEAAMEERVYRSLEDNKDQKAVVSLVDKHSEFIFKSGYLIGQIKEAFKQEGMQGVVQRLQPRGGIPRNHYELFDAGLDCEILEINSPGWQKGKLRIKVVLEFSPDVPVQPPVETLPPGCELEKIRQTLQN